MIVIILSLCIIICIINCFLQNYHLFVSSQTMKSLPGPVRVPFIGGISSFILRKPEGNINNNNNNVIIRLIYKKLWN